MITLKDYNLQIWSKKSVADEFKELSEKDKRSHGDFLELLLEFYKRETKNNVEY